MFQIHGENQNNNNNEIPKDFQKIYSRTSPLDKSLLEKREINNINSSSQSHSKTTNDKNMKYTKNDLNSNIIPTLVHNESSLVKNLQYLDEDNINLREALSELNMELKEKEEALNESQKILRKINDEYSQMVKEFKKLEEEKNIIQEENDKIKKKFDNMNKNLNEYDKIIKQNEQLKEELIKKKDIMNNLKGNYTNVTNDYNKIEKENKIKEIIIKDLKIEGSKTLNMLQDRELLIQSYSKKIEELNGIIKQKDDQLKLLVNFSKEINSENKLNVKELTKQAVKTIKVVYNSLNNKDDPRQQNFIEIKRSDEDKNINKNLSEIIFGNNNNNASNSNNNNNNNIDNDKKTQCSFLLNEAIKSVIYIPDIGVNFINKEFLIDNNFKTCLLKTELFSSAIREIELYSFFSKIFTKLDEGMAVFNSRDILNNKNSGEKTKCLDGIKKVIEKNNKSLIEYKKENIILKSKLKELLLYINKLKKDFGEKNAKIKERIKKIGKIYGKFFINEVEYDKKDKNENQNDEIFDRGGGSWTYRCWGACYYKEIDTIKNINKNIKQDIIDKDEIINKLKIENEKLLMKLNTFRTNPNAENNIKFYNSFSVNYKNKFNNLIENSKISRNKKNINFSECSNSNDINCNYNITNKISNSNNDFLYEGSSNDFLSNNSMKYSTKTTSKNFTNKKNIRQQMIRNMNEFSNNNYNENDITNIFFKSNSYNNNFTNLKIQKQENIIFLENKNKNIQFNSNSNSPIVPIRNNNLLPEFRNSTKVLEKELLKSILAIINDFKSEIKEEVFIDLTNKNYKISKTIQILNSKIEEIKNNLSNIKDKFKDSHNDKKIKPTQLMDIMEQVEKLLLYVNNHLNKAKNDIQYIQPYFKIIFDLILKIVYDSPFNQFNNNCDITPNTININTLQNTSLLNNNFLNVKDNIINNNNKSFVNQINEEENEDVINNTRTKESLFTYFQELKQFFDINKKIFSSSELIKYRTIYDGLPISKLLKVFKNICDNLKKTIVNSKNEYDSDISDVEESNLETKNSQITTDNNSYHFVNQKIFGLKKFEFNYKIFMELLKNYLVTFEIIVNQIEIEIEKKNKEKQIELGEELNILYNIFEDAVYFKMDRLDDNI